jgi:hypothetical protein
MEEKDWEARFEPSETRPPRMPRLFSWTAFVVALVYSASITWLLIENSHNVDGEAITVAWMVFGFPWIFVVGAVLKNYFWLAIPLTALTVYFLILAGLAAFRNVFGVNRAQSKF